MREIKFRGKDIIGCEFIYGDLIHGVGSKAGKCFILPLKINLAYVKNCDPLDGVEVDTETIEQFTGLKDKNGKEIYEGDIYKRILDKKNIYKKEYEWADYWLVSWIVDDCCFTTTCIANNDNGKYIKINNWASKQNPYSKRFNEFDEYIGNVHENPELLN